MQRTTVVIPEDLREQAKALDVNISDVCRYALEAVVSAAKAVRDAGPGFESVTLTLEHQKGGDEELVQFTGKPVYFNADGDTWYLTPKNRIVYLDGSGDPYTLGDDFVVFDSIEELRSDVASYEDLEGEFHRALQAIEEALGQAPTPRMLDI